MNITELQNNRDKEEKKMLLFAIQTTLQLVSSMAKRAKDLDEFGDLIKLAADKVADKIK